MSDVPRKVNLKGLVGYTSQIDQERSVSFFPIPGGAVWNFKWGDDEKMISLTNDVMDRMEAFRSGWEKLGREGFEELYGKPTINEGSE